MMNQPIGRPDNDPVHEPTEGGATSRRLLRRVAARMRLASIGRRSYRVFMIASAVYAALLLVARLLALIPDVFSPWSLLGLPLVAVLSALLLHRRPDVVDAARTTDAAVESKNLFLTATLIDTAPGEYQPLVARQAEASARSIQAQRVLPFRWRRPLGYAVVTPCVLLLAVLFLPQFDPFGKEEIRAERNERRQKLDDSRTATKLRKAQLAKKDTDKATDEVKKAIDSLKATFNKMKPEAKEANLEKLNDHQQQIGKMWRDKREENLRQALKRQSASQRFGGASERAREWKKELAQGKTRALRRELKELAEMAKDAAEASTPEERRKLQRLMEDRLKELSDFMASDMTSSRMNDAMTRALQQLQMSEQPGMSADALAAMAESLDLAGMEMSEMMQSLQDLQALEEALKTMQMAKMANQLQGLDGQAGEGFAEMADYAELYASMMQSACQGCGAGNCSGGGQCPGGGPGSGQGSGQGGGKGQGMGGPGTGEGGTAPEDDTLQTAYKSEKSKSAVTAGRMLLQWKTKEDAKPGRVVENYSDRIDQVKQGVSEAILQEQVPPGYHESIKQYFDTL